MKCEIINGWLVVQPTTATEQWAFDQWINGVPSYHSVTSHVRIAGKDEPAQPGEPELFDPFGPG